MYGPYEPVTELPSWQYTLTRISLYAVPGTIGTLTTGIPPPGVPAPAGALTVKVTPPDAGTAVTSYLVGTHVDWGSPTLNLVAFVLGSHVGLSSAGWSVHVLFTGISKSAKISLDFSPELMRE